MHAHKGNYLGNSSDSVHVHIHMHVLHVSEVAGSGDSELHNNIILWS